MAQNPALSTCFPEETKRNTQLAHLPQRSLQRTVRTNFLQVQPQELNHPDHSPRRGRQSDRPSEGDKIAADAITQTPGLRGMTPSLD